MMRTYSGDVQHKHVDKTVLGIRVFASDDSSEMSWSNGVGPSETEARSRKIEAAKIF